MTHQLEGIMIWGGKIEKKGLMKNWEFQKKKIFFNFLGFFTSYFKMYFLKIRIFWKKIFF